jgi:DHA1 family bicyclomycin/chloramphenicol resistance-like MFS transporter
MKKSVLWLLGALSMIGPFTFDAYLAALPTIASQLHTTNAMVQWTVIANMAGVTAGMLLTGSISDTLGRRRPIITAMVVYSLASLAIVFTSNIGLFIALRVIQGYCGGSVRSVGQAVIRDRLDGQEAARAFSLLSIINAIGPIVAPMVGAGLLLIGTWRDIFLMLTALGVALVLWSTFGLKETLPAGNRIPFSARAITGSWGSLLKDRAFLAAGLVNALSSVALVCYLSSGTFALQQDFHMTPQQFGVFMGLNGITLIAAGTANNQILKHRSFKAAFKIGMAVAVATGALMAVNLLVPGQLALYLAALICLNAAMGFVIPNAMNLALLNHRDNAGSAAGLAGLMGSASGSIGAIVLSQFLGVNAITLALFIALPFLASGAALLIYPGRPRPE